MVRNAFQRASPLCTDIAAAGRNHPQVSRQGVCDSFAGRRNDDEYHLIRNASSEFRHFRTGTWSASDGRKRNQRKTDLFHHPALHQESAQMGCGGTGYSRYLLLQQVYHVERHPQQCSQTDSKQGGLQPHQRKDRMGRNCGRSGCRLHGQAVISGRYCAAHHCRFISAGSDLWSGARQDFYPARPSGNRKVPNDNEYHRQRTL